MMVSDDGPCLKSDVPTDGHELASLWPCVDLSAIVTGELLYGGLPDPFDRVLGSPDSVDVPRIVIDGVSDLRAGEDSTWSGHDVWHLTITEFDAEYYSGVAYGCLIRCNDAECYGIMSAM